MKLVSLFCLIVLCQAIPQRSKGIKKQKFADGVEFNEISRSTLLKILSAFEENIYRKLEKKRLKPVFTAQFANNQYTRRFAPSHMSMHPQHSQDVHKDVRRTSGARALSVISNTPSSSFQMIVKPEPGFWTKTSWIQLMYGVWVNMSQLAIGLAFGFPAVQVPQLSAPGSNVPITRDEGAWIASIMTLFSPIGSLISGYMMDRIGRRIMLIVSQAPMCLGWLYTGLAGTATHIIIGRIIVGIGCGMAMGPPRIYSTEISLPNMRGVIGAFPALAVSIGISAQAGLGNFLDWEVLCFIGSGFTFCNLLMYFFLPETPYYVLIKESSESARRTLAKFRSAKYHVDSEIEQLIDFKKDNDIRKLSVIESIKALFTRSSCKPFSIIITYVFISQVSGISAILMWAVEILTVANSSFNVNAGNFLMAITRLIVGLVTSILLFKVGRKPLALFSAAGVSFVCLALGLFILYSVETSVIPQIGFIAYMAFASVGYYTLPFLMMAELYPLQVRGTLGGITVSIACVLIFASIKLYPYFSDGMGLAYTIIMYGTWSLLGTLFIYYFLPETKELTLGEIEEYYNARRSTLLSQRQIMSLQLEQISNKSMPTARARSRSNSISLPRRSLERRRSTATDQALLTSVTTAKAVPKKPIALSVKSGDNDHNITRKEHESNSDESKGNVRKEYIRKERRESGKQEMKDTEHQKNNEAKDKDDAMKLVQKQVKAWKSLESVVKDEPVSKKDAIKQTIKDSINAVKKADAISKEAKAMKKSEAKRKIESLKNAKSEKSDNFTRTTTDTESEDTTIGTDTNQRTEPMKSKELKEGNISNIHKVPKAKSNEETLTDTEHETDSEISNNQPSTSKKSR